jgi:hypothetical protein
MKMVLFDLDGFREAVLDSLAGPPAWREREGRA